jgi:hypothetical protein
MVAATGPDRAGEATADEEKGFQRANTVLVSSTVSRAATPSTAHIANWGAPGRHNSIDNIINSCHSAKVCLVG